MLGCYCHVFHIVLLCGKPLLFHWSSNSWKIISEYIIFPVYTNYMLNLLRFGHSLVRQQTWDPSLFDLPCYVSNIEKTSLFTLRETYWKTVILLWTRGESVGRTDLPSIPQAQQSHQKNLVGCSVGITLSVCASIKAFTSEDLSFHVHNQNLNITLHNKAGFDKGGKNTKQLQSDCIFPWIASSTGADWVCWVEQMFGFLSASPLPHTFIDCGETMWDVNKAPLKNHICISTGGISRYFKFSSPFCVFFFFLIVPAGHSRGGLWLC